MADLGAKIAKAKASGYSDAEITAFLGQDAALAPKIQQARKAGYKDADIVSHLSTGGAPASSTPDRVASGGIAGLITGKTQPKRSVLADISGAFASANRQIPLMDELAAGIGVGVDAARGKVRSLSDVGDSWNRNRQDQKQIEGSFNEAHPNVAALSRGTGMAAGVLTPGGATAKASVLAPRVANMARGALTAGLTGAAYAAAGEGTAQERLAAASKASHDLPTLALGAGAGALAPALRKAPKAKISDDVMALRAEGIPLTRGQAAGGLGKSIEDSATSLPILGQAINDARRGGLEGLNKAVANLALSKVGQRLPGTIKAGNEAVAYVKTALSKAYDDVIPKGGVKRDAELDRTLSDIAPIAQTLTPENLSRLDNILQQRITSRLGGGKIDGPMFQKVRRELEFEIQRFSKSNDADHQSMAEALKVASKAIDDAAMRQNPAFAAAKKRIDAGYAEYKRMEAASAQASAEQSGVFGAGQYGGAVKKGDISKDKSRFAQGNALGYDLAGSAQRVLPSKVPDSGTATRSMIGAIASAPAAIVTGAHFGGLPGAVAAGAAVAAPLVGLKAASRLYGPKAVEAFNVALDSRISRQGAAAAMTQLKNLAASNPKLKPLYDEAVKRLAMASGASRAPQGIDLGDIDRSTNPQFLASQRARNVLATEGR